MTTTEADNTSSTTLAVLAIDAITVREGWNPRTSDDEVEHDALTASIRAQGILQPLLVERTDAGYLLIDGHRRLAAARAAGLVTMPVMERTGEDGDASQLAAALAANMRRRGLDPIEEARGYARAAEAGWAQRRIAEAVGCSPRHVSQRMRLLRLPEVVQEAVGVGVLPLSAVPTVETISAVAPAVAEALAAALTSGAITAAELTEHPEGALAELARIEGDWPCLTLVGLPGYRDLAALAADDAGLSARAEAAGVHGLNLSADDMDAARAFGALIEFTAREDRYWRRGFVADADWLRDRVRLHIERAEEETQQEAERRADEAGARAERAAHEATERGDDPEQAAAEVLAESDADHRARERVQVSEDRRRARLANLDLGRLALLAYDEPAALTIEMARAIALTALHHHQGEAARGLVLCHERLQSTQTRTTKAGATREKITYAETQEAERALGEWIGGARTPEQIIGRALQALMLAWYSDQGALPKSERRPASVPGKWGGGIATALPQIVTDLVRPVLPERMAEQARERDAWTGEALADLPATVGAEDDPDAQANAADVEHAEAAKPYTGRVGRAAGGGHRILSDPPRPSVARVPAGTPPDLLGVRRLHAHSAERTAHQEQDKSHTNSRRTLRTRQRGRTSERRWRPRPSSPPEPTTSHARVE